MQLGLFPQYKEERKRKRPNFSLHTAYRLLEKDFQQQIDLQKILMEKEEKLRLITDALPAMVGYVDTQGRYCFNNKEYEVRYGMPREEIYGRHVTELMPPAFREQILNGIKQVMQGRETSCEIAMEFLSHGECIMNVLFLPHEGTDGSIQGFFVVLSDVTGQKHFQQKLQQLASIVESSEDAIIGTTLEGVITSWNQGAERIYGYVAGEIIGCHLITLAPPAYRSEIWSVIHGIRQGLRVQPYDTITRKKDGDLLHVSILVSPVRDIDGETVGLSVIARDISERVQADELFRTAFHANPSMMSIQSFETRQIIDVNESWLKNTGYKKEEVLGTNTYDLGLYKGETPIVELWRKFSRCGLLHNEEIQYRTKTGEIHTGLMSAERLFFRGQKCALVVVNDVTERKKLEEELTRLDRLNVIGQMAAGVGHEIRNPMTTVRGFLQALDKREDCQHLTEYFSLMIEELDHANCIIKEFLSFANNKAVDLRKQDLSKIVESMLPLLQTEAVSTHKRIEADLAVLPLLLLDDQEIRQLILNIVRNGLEAMDNGGILSIRTYRKGKDVILAIQDQGPGIRPDILPKIGTPFVTTKNNGAGLGLAVCYSIAARNNANISVDTGPQGTTFYIKFNRDSNTVRRAE